MRLTFDEKLVILFALGTEEQRYNDMIENLKKSPWERAPEEIKKYEHELGHIRSAREKIQNLRTWG